MAETIHPSSTWTKLAVERQALEARELEALKAALASLSIDVIAARPRPRGRWLLLVAPASEAFVNTPVQVPTPAASAPATPAPVSVPQTAPQPQPTAEETVAAPEASANDPDPVATRTTPASEMSESGSVPPADVPPQTGDDEEVSDPALSIPALIDVPAADPLLEEDPAVLPPLTVPDFWETEAPSPPTESPHGEAFVLPELPTLEPPPLPIIHPDPESNAQPSEGTKDPSSDSDDDVLSGVFLSAPLDFSLPTLQPLGTGEPVAEQDEPTRDEEVPRSPAPMGLAASSEAIDIADLERAADSPYRVRNDGKKRRNPFKNSSSNPRERAERLARTLVSDIIEYRKDEYLRVVDKGVAGIREAFLEDIDIARDQFYAQVNAQSVPDRDAIFIEAVNNILGKGEPILES